MKIRVEYESTPIRHIAIQCPKCENWFHSSDVTDKHLGDIVDVQCAEYHCPICKNSWNQYHNSGLIEVEKCSGRAQVHRETKNKTIGWE